jgi:predicted permease
MALRVSIGAGRGRLVQLTLVEGALLALGAAALGGLFAWWATPFVVGHINPPDNPVRLLLPADWRVLGFGFTLTVVVTMLFGLSPALRAAHVNPTNALKGGADVPSRRRVMHGVIAAQTAFCVLVLFAGGLFVVSFERLSSRPLGFSAERVLVLDAVPASPQSPVVWEEVAEHLRSVAGVESVAVAGWPLLSRNSWNGFVSIEGAPPGSILAYFLSVSPGWITTMKIPLIHGRDFLPDETSPGVALVNETFVKRFFDDVANPIGRTFSKGPDRYRIIGVVGDVPYRSVREPMLPAVYVPFRGIDLSPRGRAAFIVRTVGSPYALAPLLRQEVTRARREFRVSNVRTQVEINEAHTVRDRLLAMLALFFTTVAAVLAGVGLYGVLEYSVVQLRRDIGVRLALGASAAHVARRVALRTLSRVALGALVGLALSLGLARYIQTLLYDVKATDSMMVAFPSLAVFFIALLAATVPVVRASRTDPAAVLRSD